MPSVQRLLLISTVMVLALVSIGGFVRAAGAGLGCPDWPFCFGRLVPPTSVDQLPAGYDPAEFNAFKTWTEFLNRLFGASTGLVVSATLLVSLRRRNRRRAIWLPTLIAWALTVFAGWLGKIVVEKDLDPRMVTVHLLVALGVVASLMFACFASREARWPKTGEISKEGKIAYVALALLLAQIVLGALVRGELELIKTGNPALERAEWIERLSWVDMTHRRLSVLLFGLLGYGWWRARQSPPATTWGKRLPIVALGLCCAQIAAGLVLAYLGLPPAFQLVHLTLATWLAATLLAQGLFSARRDAAPSA